MVSEKVCLKIVVKGLVQGIGYRWFVQEIAEQEGIAGYVRNNDDGSVEIVAEADDRTKIEKFINRIRTEHKYAVVKDIEVTSIEPKHYKGFKILF